MKKIAISFVSGCILAVASTAVFALEEPAANPVDIAHVLDTLQQQGYIAVHEIKLDNNVYEAEAIDSMGAKIDVKVNALTGAILEPKLPPSKMTMKDAIKKAENSGFKNIYSIESHDDGFEMKAFNHEGKKIEYHLNLNGQATTKEMR